jgi:hypothetical protein
MKKITIILILIFSISCTDVNKLVEEISKDERMESEHIGFIGAKSEQYQNFQKLKSKASDEELRNLITHENPILKTYAYQSLIERKLIKPSEAFEEAMQNNQSFSKMSGCSIMGTDICTQIYFEIINFYPDSKREIKQIDSLILFKMDENHFLQYMALKDKKHEEMYNDRIINMALDYHNASAIFYIVENKIKIDKPKFKESIKTVIKNGGIGSQPIERLKRILVKFDDENKKEN